METRAYQQIVARPTAPDALTTESSSHDNLQQETSVAANMKRMSLDTGGGSKGRHPLTVPLASAGTPGGKEMQVDSCYFFCTGATGYHNEVYVLG